MGERIRFMRWTPTAAVEFCKRRDNNGFQISIVDNALPDDAEFVRAGIDQLGYIRIVIKSASFDEVNEGDPIPELKATTFRRDRMPANV